MVRQHRHRSAGDCRTYTVCSLKQFRRSASAFRWGSQYSHFFYALEASAPFSLLATSNEFCLGTSADGTDCESVQFVSGLQLRARAKKGEEELLVAYGVNDCEAKLARVDVARVLASLRPV